MRRTLSLAVAFTSLLSLVSLAVVSAENWPSWRGPMMNGISNERNLPVKWTTEENVTWKLAMPDRSGSTPIIWDNLIFLNVADGTKTAGTLSFWGIDRATGKILWKKPLGDGDHMMRKQNMSSPSPVTDGKTVWVLTGNGLLRAFDFKGNELWLRDIQKDYGKFGLNWGYGSSPLLYEDALYVPVLHGMRTDDPSYLLKIDKVTGKTIWRHERPTPAITESPDAYITPALLKQGNATQIVLSGGDCVTGHDPATGKELWRAYGLNPQNIPFNRIVNSPIVVDGLIYAGSRGNPYMALKSGGSGDITSTHVAWTFANGPDVPTPVTDGKYFYLLRDNGTLFCLDAKTGKEIYANQRLKPGTYSASPVLADGKIYATSEEGFTIVVKAGPQFEILAENELGDYCLSSPAISDGQLFMRTSGFLYCIGKRAKK
ncbi:MAG: PQQ-binding-like beta-propeller repeat protein [Acidobacteria bacterium]|nr:PQQ-binding-like beta-propeller repeat protein [Acidobacteriota bacterium]